MPKQRSSFLGYVLGLMALGFAASFFWSVLSLREAAVLYSFALNWELASALGRLSAWAPALLFVAAALAAERSEGGPSYHDMAYTLLTPAFIIAAALSLFFLLAVPYADARAHWYENASADFNRSLSLAKDAYDSGDYAAAEAHILRCKAIDRSEQRYIDLNDRIQEALIRASDRAADTRKGEPAASEAPGWFEANRFYLEALSARDEGRFFDAHYLARRSLALYPGRRDVAKLVDESWTLMRSLAPSAQEVEDAAFYRRKLEGYRLFSANEYLEAYRLYTALAEIRPDDPDVANYREKSAQGLLSLAFFIDEEERAFSQANARPLSLSKGQGSDARSLSARAAVSSPSGVYMRDLVYLSATMELRAPFGRIRDDALYLKAVDKDNPARLWEPLLIRGADVAATSVIDAPFSEAETRRYLELSAEPSELALLTLMGGLDDAERLGLDRPAFLEAVAVRLSYPFVTVMLVLLGAAMGLRFRPKERPGMASTLFWAPAMAGLTLPALSVALGPARLAIAILAQAMPGSSFLPAWIAFLSICVVICVFSAARIAMHAPRR
jgi:tetratricopeptide (TPR) repeat protein